MQVGRQEGTLSPSVIHIRAIGTIPPAPLPFRFWQVSLPYSKQGGVDYAHHMMTCPFEFSGLPKALHIGLVLLHEQTSCQKIYEWG